MNLTPSNSLSSARRRLTSSSVQTTWLCTTFAFDAAMILKLAQAVCLRSMPAFAVWMRRPFARKGCDECVGFVLNCSWHTLHSWSAAIITGESFSSRLVMSGSPVDSGALVVASESVMFSWLTLLTLASSTVTGTDSQKSYPQPGRLPSVPSPYIWPSSSVNSQWRDICWVTTQRRTQPWNIDSEAIDKEELPFNHFSRKLPVHTLDHAVIGGIYCFQSLEQWWFLW